MDVVVAVHNTSRPIDRAVGSILDGTDAAVRVTVVCHGLSSDAIGDRLGSRADHPSVRLVEHHDEVASPAGPFNAGLDLASAEFTAVLGSDDELEPHAIDAWLATARRTGARAVICRQRFVSGKLARTPITRPWRSRGLDPVEDRLAYRTAPLGLISRHDFSHIRFSDGLTTGEDIAYGLHVWFSGAAISFARHDPGYIVHDEATVDRVTSPIRDPEDEFAFLPHVIETSWFDRLSIESKTSIGIKLLRSHVVPAVLARSQRAKLEESDAAAFTTIVNRIGSATARRSMEVLSRRDARLLDALGHGSEAVSAASEAYRRRVPAAALLPNAPRRIFDRESPPRLLAAAAFNRS
ncbi:glycosyltransferase family 2 protein [Microbacterium sp. NPDC055521]